MRSEPLTDLLCFRLPNFCGDGDEDLPALLSAVLHNTAQHSTERSNNNVDVRPS
jgi:hypothetical protein